MVGKDAFDGVEVVFRHSVRGRQVSKDIVDIMSVVVADEKDGKARETGFHQRIIEPLPVDDGLALVDALPGVGVKVIAHEDDLIKLTLTRFQVRIRLLPERTAVKVRNNKNFHIF